MTLDDCLTPGAQWKTQIVGRRCRVDIHFAAAIEDGEGVESRIHALLEAAFARPQPRSLGVMVTAAFSTGSDFVEVAPGIFASDSWSVHRRVLNCWGRDCVLLSIRSRDDANTSRPWDVFLELKRRFIGPDAYAVEVYPSDEDVVDSSDTWHIMEVPFPIGFRVAKQTNVELQIRTFDSRSGKTSYRTVVDTNQ